MLPSGVYHWRFLVTKGQSPAKWEIASHKKKKLYNGELFNVKRLKSPERELKRSGSGKKEDMIAIFNDMPEAEEIMRSYNSLFSNVVSKKDIPHIGQIITQKRKKRLKKIMPPPIQNQKLKK